MKEISEATFCVVDHGLGLPIARRLGQDAKRVLYHTPWENGFARIHQCILGRGFDNIERCDDPWLVKKDVDCWVFPDCQHAGWQLELESQGYPVWGARQATDLEMNRERFQILLGELGLKQAPYEKVVGLDNLRVFLRDKKDKYIKISKYRGSFETCHWRSWDEDHCNLDAWGVEFGPTHELIPFLVFEPIGDGIEIGGDTYGIDGQWPKLLLRGDEWKDKSYLSAVTKFDDMPDPIKEVLNAFSSVLKQYRCRSQWSMELRGQGDEWFFTDPTPRLGLPSTASQLTIWKNWPEIVYAGAHGELVEPEPTGEFTAEASIVVDGEKGTWRKMRVPEALTEAAQLGYCCEINGMACFPPDECHEEHVGWLVAKGDSIKETIKTLQGYAKQLPDGVSAKTDSLVNLLKEIDDAEQEGIPFSDEPIPKPEIVVQNA